MTQHDPLVSVRQMLDYAEEALQIAAGRARTELDTDRLFNLAIVRLLEITGEAARRVPETFRMNHPDVPWRQIADMRNRLIHGYRKLTL